MSIHFRYPWRFFLLRLCLFCLPNLFYPGSIKQTIHCKIHACIYAFCFSYGLKVERKNSLLFKSTDEEMVIDFCLYFLVHFTKIKNVHCTCYHVRYSWTCKQGIEKKMSRSSNGYISKCENKWEWMTHTGIWKTAKAKYEK